jgi:hypothetical protein
MLLAALALPARLLAQPLGAEVQVNSYTTADQNFPVVDYDSAGNFVVVWHSYGQDGSDRGIFGQRFASTGSMVGGEFRVNFETAGAQSYAGLAVNAAGAFLAVWQDAGRDAGTTGVYGRAFDSSGQALGLDFQVNTYTSSTQDYPAAAALAGGGFVVVWESYQGKNWNIFGQRYSSSGTAVGGEFQASLGGGNVNRYLPAVAADPSGGFVVVWAAYSGGGSLAPLGILGHRFDASGVSVGSDFAVSTTTASYLPSVAASSAGFVVAWYGNATGDASGYGVLARRFDSSGNALVAQFRVNSYTSANQSYPRVAAGSGGNFVVTWMSGPSGTDTSAQDGNGTGVFAREYSGNGTAVGGELQINTYTTGDQSIPWVAMKRDGSRYAVVWGGGANEDGNGAGVFAQRGRTSFDGDANGDGHVDVSDVFYLVNFLFAGGPAPRGPSNVNGIGQVDVGDVFTLINFLFAGGPPPV